MDVIRRRLTSKKMTAAATVSRILDANRSVCQGLLQKRCRLCWRPRYVELILDPADYSNTHYAFQLLIFDPRRRMLKDKIRMDDIVTIRASRDCYFQVFLSSGKILQFKTETTDSQAYWMAMLKVGLGKGNIFHIRVHTPLSNLEHCLLYSIGVNLPAHRVGQVDRVLVLASPVNDINVHAWDFNRMKRFIELDIGIQMELCVQCVRAQKPVTTFIMEKQFIRDCARFLCREARISDQPQDENGFLVYKMPHKCGFNTQPLFSAPPPYEAQSEHQREGPQGRDIPPPIPSRPTAFSFGKEDWDYGSSTDDEEAEYLPPRSIPRKNFECSIPAVAQPYVNFQPHLFNSGSARFDAPYQISSRIIITDSGEVQYERNILGNSKRHHGGFHFTKQLPLPPRRTQVKLQTQFQHHSSAEHQRAPTPPPEIPPKVPMKVRSNSSPQHPPLRIGGAQFEPKWISRMSRRHSSEPSANDDCYVIANPGSLTLGRNEARPMLSEEIEGERLPCESDSSDCDDNHDYEDVVSVTVRHRTESHAQPQVPLPKPKPRKGLNVTRNCSANENTETRGIPNPIPSEGTSPIPPPREGTSPIPSPREGTSPILPQNEGTSPILPPREGTSTIPPPREGTPPILPPREGTSPIPSPREGTPPILLPRERTSPIPSPREREATIPTPPPRERCCVSPEKVATRGNDQAGLLDHEAGYYSKLTRGGDDAGVPNFSTKQTVPPKPLPRQLLPPKPKPRSRTIVHVNVNVEHPTAREYSAGASQLHQSVHYSKSVNVGESEML